MDFSGQSVLVTGAGKGIGRALVRQLVEANAEVVALSRSAEDLEAIAAEHGCRTITCDLADPKATRAAARAAVPVDLLVNCAGTTALDAFLDLPEENFDHLMTVNCKAPMIVSQEIARDWVARGHKGAIVNVSSMASLISFTDHAAYCASKGALDAMSRVMANELGRHGIRVNCVNPTVTLTPMAVKAWSDPEKAGRMLARIPLDRFAEPEDVGDVIMYLLSPQAGMVNGIVMPVDGGFWIT